MKKAKLFLGLLMTAGALSLTGCDLFNSSNTSSDVTKETENHENDEKYKIFLLAKQSGFDGTYEEWLDSIKGDFVQMRVSNTDLEWKYSKDTNWTKLITLTDLVTAKEAKEIEISTSATHITWRYVGENGWKNLVEIATLHGNDGDSAYDIAVKAGFNGTVEAWIESLKGVDGKQVELRTANNKLEWKYATDTEWQELVTLTDLVVQKEAKEIIISTSATHIVWHYEGENGWHDLVELSSLAGNEGKSAYEVAKEVGFTGTAKEWIESLKGADGKQVELRTNENKLEWKYATDIEWQELVTLTDLVVQKEAKEIEISTSATHIVWRYEGENGWHDLVDLSSLAGNAGKSAYDIAKEVGFTGSAEEWVESLKGEKGDTGNGISKIEKTDSNGLVDTYTIYFTDGSTYEFTIKNGSVDEDIPEESKDLAVLEIIGRGYLVTGYYSLDNPNSKDVVIPSTYNGKKIYAVQLNNEKLDNITIPNTLDAIVINTNNLFFDGTELELLSNKTATIVADNVYVLDENGTVENNGKKYSKLPYSIYYGKINNYNFDGTIEEFINSDIYNTHYLFKDLYLNGKKFDGTVVIADGTKKMPDVSRLLDIETIVIPSSVDYIEKDIFKGLPVKNVYYNGSLLDYSKIVFENEYSNPLCSSNTYFYTIENKDFELVKDITITDEFDFEDTYWYYGIYGNQVVINQRKSYSSNLNDFVMNFDIVIFNDTFAANEIFFMSNPFYYFLDEDGQFEYLGNKYNNYYLMKIKTSNPIENKTISWNPLSLKDVKDSYTIKGSLNTAIVYSKTSGITYNGAIKGDTTNPIDGKEYQTGDLLPAWQAFADKLGIQNITSGLEYGGTDAVNYTKFRETRNDSGQYIDINGDVTDLFYNTTNNLNALGDAGEAIDLLPYITDGKMPALAKFLQDNPAILTEIIHNGHIYYTPYMDGYQAVERGFVMDTEQVAKLLDYELPSGTGNLAAGLNGDVKGLKSAPKAEAFVGTKGMNYDSNTLITIVNPKDTTKTVEVTVKQTSNILDQQNKLLSKGTTGKELIEQFKDYAMSAYGDIINTYYDGNISKMFTSVGACYNADDLVALLRIFKANPDVLYGSADLYDEVVPVFPRGQANNRVENILNFGATLYGVQGRDSEYDHLYFGADGKLHDFDTTRASYDLLDKLNALYSEGLIQQNFWAGSNNNLGYSRFFAKTADNSSFGLLEYDYFATQSSANDLYNGIGTANSNRKTSESGFKFSQVSVTGIMPILSPLTYVSTESFSSTQALDDKTGKSIVRYYEGNRSVKNTSWCIPSSSDNIETAIALMDFMFTKEGWEIQNFGPEGYWDYGTVLGEENTPIIKQEVLDHFANSGVDFWTYSRGFLGTAQGIGHYRPVSLDYQATNYYSHEGYNNVVIACDLGVQINARAVASSSECSWHASMPMAAFSTMDVATSTSYAGVTNFWAQNGKATPDGTPNGWVAIVAEGKDYSGYVVPNANNGISYTYSDVKSEIQTKNSTYLYYMGKALGLVPDEAYDKN